MAEVSHLVAARSSSCYRFTEFGIIIIGVNVREQRLVLGSPVRKELEYSEILVGLQKGENQSVI